MMETIQIGQKLAPFNPTHEEAVDIAIDMLSITNQDIVYDLGCGDGRFIMQSLQKIGIKKGVGIEYDSSLVERALDRCNCREGEVNHEILHIIHGNVLDVDFSEADVLFIYLVPEGMRSIQSKLLEMLRKGCRIVTYVFSIPDIAPRRVEVFKGSTKLYLYQFDVVDIENSLSKVTGDANLVKCIFSFLSCHDLVTMCIAGNKLMRAIFEKDRDVDDWFRQRICQDLGVHRYLVKDTTKRPGYFRRLYLDLREELIAESNLVCGGH
jgi:precorrin-6B methylase 2